MDSNVKINMQKTIKAAESMLNKPLILKAKNRDKVLQMIKFTSQKIIGRGGFGVVSKILYENGEYCSMKTVLTQHSAKQKELEFLLKLDHKNIVKLQHFFYTRYSDSSLFLNMCLEYCSTCLEDLIKKKISLQFIKIIYLQLMCGLEYLHSKNICHGDIKPGNILLDDMGCLKICDFGTAVYVKPRNVKETINGTFIYRAPENLRDSSVFTTKIDIWSSACVIAQAMLNKVLFPGITKVEVLDSIEKAFLPEKIDEKAENLCMRGSLSQTLYEQCNDEILRSLVLRSLDLDPTKRITAKAAIKYLSQV